MNDTEKEISDLRVQVAFLKEHIRLIQEVERIRIANRNKKRRIEALEKDLSVLGFDNEALRQEAVRIDSELDAAYTELKVSHNVLKYVRDVFKYMKDFNNIDWVMAQDAIKVLLGEGDEPCDMDALMRLVKKNA